MMDKDKEVSTVENLYDETPPADGKETYRPIQEYNLALQMNEDREWAAWEEKLLPLAFKNFTSTGTKEIEEDWALSQVAQDDCLGHTFQIGKYYQINVRAPEEASYIVFVHCVMKNSAQLGEVNLLVTKFSFLASSPILEGSSKAELGHVIDKNELLLHFFDYQNMGTQSDAEVIATKDIVPHSGDSTTEQLHDFPLLYCVKVPTDLDPGDHFCRYATYSGGDEGTAWLTPISPHLVQPKYRRKSPKYMYPCSPAVWDTSPTFLGLSEGFKQSGFTIQAAFNFDKSVDMTWKVRYQDATVYDTPPQATFQNFSEKDFLAPEDTLAKAPRTKTSLSKVFSYHLII
ncbi:hypothetical protein PVAG01_04201 [Phlyctema vagabunda]|uniref:Uncharacterized protein n=1 Tax=Phlyctema vagabunda TaxID=108571 RepID=A0ABR4PNL7_9HELO